MDASTLVDEIQARGASIRTEDGRLLVRNDEALPDELRAAIRELKPALLELLYYREIESGARQPDYILPSGIPVFIPPGMASYSEGVQVSDCRTPAPWSATPNPFPPILDEYRDIIELADCGELYQEDASLVLTAAREIALLAPTEAHAEKLSKTRRGCVIRLLLDISEVEHRENQRAAQSAMVLKP